MSVLVDTSVWVAHFRQHNDGLAQLLTADQALTHPMVVAELACGTPPAPRQTALNLIRHLRPAPVASLDEVVAFVEREALYGLGCGLIDLSLLASALLTPGTRLWTLDKRLQGLAERYGVAFAVPAH
jgi:predicted nucleic acid-binding protein